MPRVRSVRRDSSVDREKGSAEWRGGGGTVVLKLDIEQRICARVERVERERERK